MGPALSACLAGASGECCEALSPLSSKDGAAGQSCLCYSDVYFGLKDVIKDQGLEDMLKIDEILAVCNGEFDLGAGFRGEGGKDLCPADAHEGGPGHEGPSGSEGEKEGPDGGFPGDFGGFPGDFGGFPGDFGGPNGPGFDSEGSGSEGSFVPERCSEENLTPLVVPALSTCLAGASGECCEALSPLSSKDGAAGQSCLCYSDVYFGLKDVIKDQGLEDMPR